MLIQSNADEPTNLEFHQTKTLISSEKESRKRKQKIKTKEYQKWHPESHISDSHFSCSPVSDLFCSDDVSAADMQSHFLKLVCLFSTSMVIELADK